MSNRKNTKRGNLPELPPVICFRITRNCNSRCCFCFAPPRGIQPDGDILIHRIDWLRANGVRTIHFCGGEPTIHPSLSLLLKHVHEGGGKVRLTTNGIAISDNLIGVLRETDARVKVSLHGNQKHHDGILCVEGFENTTRNIRRLIAGGVRTSVQTTVVANEMWVVDWVADFCREAGVRRLSFLPFVARGRGEDCKDTYLLSKAQRRTLRDMVKNKRRLLSGRIDVRWLDFTARPYLVADADGKVVLEGVAGIGNKVLFEIPGPSGAEGRCLTF